MRSGCVLQEMLFTKYRWLCFTQVTPFLNPRQRPWPVLCCHRDLPLQNFYSRVLILKGKPCCCEGPQNQPSFSSCDTAELMNFFPNMPTSSSSGFSFLAWTTNTPEVAGPVLASGTDCVACNQNIQSIVIFSDTNAWHQVCCKLSKHCHVWLLFGI